MEKNSLKLVIAVVLIAATLAIATALLNDNGGNQQLEVEVEQDEVGVNVGDYPPNFSLDTLEGEQVVLHDLLGEKLVINFWASWCPPCRDEMPDLDQFNQANDDITVFGLNVREGESTVRDFVEEGGYSFPILLDRDAQIARDYAITVFPTTFFINSDGKIAHVKRGLVTEAELMEIKEDYLVD